MPHIEIPAELQFKTADWIVIVVYFIGMILLSVYLGKDQENQEDYYVGGRNIPWWAIGLSTMATQTSAVSFISIPAFVALEKGGGMKQLSYEFAVPLAMIFIMVFLIPFFRKLKLISVYEYLEMRFGPGARYFLSAVFLISRGIATAVGLFAGALVLSVCLNIPLGITIVLIGVVTLIYDTIGGMKAVVYSDVIQMGILLLGIFLCCYYALTDVGGIAEAIKVFPKERFLGIDTATAADGNRVPFWAFMFGGFFLYASYYGCDQSQTQRELSAPTTADTKKSLIFNGYFRFPLTILYIIMGLLVGAYVTKNPEFMSKLPIVDGSPKLDYMLPLFILEKIPVGFRAVIFAAILAAVMSSVDSAINSLSAASMRDFIEKWVKFEPGDEKSERLFLNYSRATTVFWGAFVTGFAFLFMGGKNTVIETINSVGSLFYGPILATFILGVTTRKINSKGIIGGVLVGVIVNLLIDKGGFVDISWMWLNMIGFFVTAITAFILSYVMPEKEKTDIEHLIVMGSDHWEEEKAWIPKYAVLVGYFILMLGFAIALPKILQALSGG